jgi:hypothetical protein
MISFVYGDPDWESLPLEDMALAAEFLAENQRRDALGYQNLIRPDELNEALAEALGWPVLTVAMEPAADADQEGYFRLIDQWVAALAQGK